MEAGPFQLDDAALENRQRGWVDFHTANDGQHDLTVRFVRLNKTEAPVETPARAQTGPEPKSP